MNETPTTVGTISQGSSDIAPRLLEWYDTNARRMPWRVPPHDHSSGVRADPYHVWLSEVMLQQTQVATVHSYFLKFVERWPTVEHLANEHEDEILKQWAGLGYYSRARNLKKCADAIVGNHGGVFPETRDALRELPGIGDYTAAAIAAIAFDEAVPVLDGNIERVMARLFRIATPFPEAKPYTREHLAAVLDDSRPGEFAQAMMDLGATVCTPKKPNCVTCPLNGVCQAHAKGDMEDFPHKAPKRIKPTRKGAAFVLQREDKAIFLRKRGDTGLLAGMSEVPTTNWNSRQDGGIGAGAAPLKADWKRKGHVRHTFTHFHLELEVWFGQVTEAGNLDGWWSKPDDLPGEALPTVFRKVLEVAIPESTKPRAKFSHNSLSR